jgi:hypothetical protein
LCFFLASGEALKTNHHQKTSGNIFFALFGAIALVGLLGAAAMTFMRGPLQSAVKITRQNTAEAQMSIAGQVAVMAAASAANNGDCDTDGFVEPLEWRDAGALPKPTGGGLIPNTIGINKKDPWGTEYGYCVWDHGPTTLNAACELTAPGTDMRLEGANSRLFPVVAIISAGPDKTFTTTCRNFATGADRADQNNDGDLLDAGDRELVGKAAPTDDDVIFTYSYEEATGASGGLWQLKSVDPNIATINKSLEVSGGATFQGTGTFQRLAATGSDFLDVLSGLRLPTPTTMPTCNIANLGVLRRNASGNGIEICNTGNLWSPVSGEGASDIFSSTATCTSVADRGKVRYDSVSQQPQFCNGTAWQPFTLGTPTAQIIITPASNYSMNIVGPCAGGNCPFAYTAWQTFTVINQGGTASGTLNTSGFITGPQAGNFEMDMASSTCDNSITLAANGGSCTVVIRARASSNTNYSASISVTDGSTPAIAPLYGTSTGFGCSNGARGWGGIVVGACTGAGGTQPGTGQLIVQEAGCGNLRNEPVCTGDPANDAAVGALGGSVVDNTSGPGPLSYINYLSYLNVLPGSAIRYCDELVKDGYDNWFLPSAADFSNIRTMWSVLSLSPTWDYHTTSRSTDNIVGGNAANISGSPASGNYVNTAIYRVRCFRYHNQALPSATTDTDPSYLTGGATVISRYNYTTYAPAPSTRVSCPTVTIVAINAPVSFSIFGDGSPAARINGGSEVTSGTLNNGDTIEMRVTSSASASGEIAAQIQIGSENLLGTCRVQNQAASRIVNMFVTDTPVNGNLGGIAGADTTCQSQAGAAGLASSGTYLAWIAGDGVTLRSRLPPDASMFRNTRLPADGGQQTIANNVDDLFDNTILAPINRTASGALVASGNAWTGAIATGAENTNTCQGFSNTVATGNGGTINATTGGNFINSTGNVTCTNTYRFYCFGPN